MITTRRTVPDVDYVEVVQALTRVARTHDADGPRDFADFLAHALAATAANVGGPDRLLAGRSGSWEASYLEGLLRGTMGDRPGEWPWFRSEPVVVPLNVAELVEDDATHPGLLGLDEAIEKIGAPYETVDREQDLDAWDGDIETTISRYTDEYRRYADRFAASARQLAALVLGLSIDVVAHAEVDPNSPWWSPDAIRNPSESTDDQLVYKIWDSAHDVTPLPNVDIWMDQPPPAPAEFPGGRP